MNLYADLGMFKRRYLSNKAPVAADQTAILEFLEEDCRAIDDYLGFAAYAQKATRDYDGNGKTSLYLPDPVLTVTTLKIDDDDNNVAELTIVEDTDFWLWPDNEAPKLRADVIPDSSALTAWPKGRHTVRITGEFGQSNATETLVSLMNEPLDTTETAIDVDDGTEFEIGQTLLIDAEQFYITGISGNTLTVVRGVNGSGAATHLDNAVIERYTYTEQIRGAAMKQAGIDWQRRESPGSSLIETPALGTIRIFTGLDSGVRRLLDPIRDLLVVA